MQSRTWTTGRPPGRWRQVLDQIADPTNPGNVTGPTAVPARQQVRFRDVMAPGLYACVLALQEAASSPKRRIGKILGWAQRASFLVGK